MPAVGGVFVDWLCFNSTGIQPVSGGGNIRHPEGQMPQPQCFRLGDTLGGVGADKQLNHRISQPQHPQVVPLGRPPGFLFDSESQLVYIKIQCLLLIRGDNGNMMGSFQHKVCVGRGGTAPPSSARIAYAG